jgi:hypothetical protein
VDFGLTKGFKYKGKYLYKYFIVVLLVASIILSVLFADYYKKNRTFDERSAAASTTLQDVLNTTGISNMVIGNPVNIIRDEVIHNLFTFDASTCSIQSDRYEVVFNKIIPNIFGLGMNYIQNQTQVDDFLDPNFSIGSYNHPNMSLNGDAGRLRTPMLVLPRENLILGYIEPFIKIARLTRANGTTNIIFKKKDTYNEGGCGQFFIIKGDSINDAYAKYNSYLKRRFFFKKPHWNAFGLGWETFLEMDCTPSLSAVKNAHNQYKSAGIPISLLTIGSGYWNSNNRSGCGTNTSNDLDDPTMDALSVHPDFVSKEALDGFFLDLQKQGIYPMIGMRHTVPPKNKANIESKIRAKGLDPAIPVFYSNNNIYYGAEPSNNVHLLNILPNWRNTQQQDVISNYIPLLQEAYGSFKGIKEDEMIPGDQKAYTGNLNQATLPDGSIKNVFSAYNSHFNGDFVIMSPNDFFGVGTDLQNGPGYIPGMPASGPTYPIKYWLDKSLIHVVSGYPHPKMEISFQLNPDGTIQDQKQFLRTYQTVTFMPGAFQSRGFWRMSDPQLRSQFVFFSQLRERLRAYAYDHAMNWYTSGVPSLMRPLFFDFQGDPNVYGQYDKYTAGQAKNQFMMGNALLISPVLDANDTIPVYFPQGIWYNIFTGQQFDGNRTTSFTIPSGVNSYPVFAKGGEPFILQDINDTFQNRLRIYPVNSYKTTYNHYNKQGNFSGKVDVNIQGTWDWNKIQVRNSNGVRIPHEKTSKGELVFNMLEGQSYSITDDLVTNNPPVGNFEFIDSNSTGNAVGWAYDPDTSNQSIDVHFYIDGPAGTGTGGLSTVANVPRPDVNQALGISGNHGFSWRIPDQFRDGKNHTIHTYGIDTAGGANALIGGSPKTFNLLLPPTGLSPSGSISAGTRNITWNPVSGATTYLLRIDDKSNPWSNVCGSMNHGDICTDVTTNSYTYTFQAGRTYDIWVHSANGSGYSEARYATVSVIAPTSTPTPTPTKLPTSTPTPKPTNTPVPTHTSTPTALPTNTPVSYKQYGDLNNDKRVDLIDLSILSQYWGTGNSNGDINSDGRVDIIDLSVLASNWGKSY